MCSSDLFPSHDTLPDKAIDLIDEAAAELKMQIESEPTALSNIKREIQTLNVEKEALKMEKSQKNEDRIKEIEKELAVRASRITARICNDLECLHLMFSL